jgi:hypothetical protein
MLSLSTLSDASVKYNKRKRGSKVSMLDLPVSQPFASPREGLSAGWTEALYQALISKSGNVNGGAGNAADDGTNDDSPICRYEYSLWTLPSNQTGNMHKHRRGNAFKVLVRIPIRLVSTSNDSDVERPIILRCHVDYFPESGREHFNTHEKVLWMMDQLVLQHRAVAKLCRVNPLTNTVLSCHDVGVAHALAEQSPSDHGPAKQNPLMASWHGAIQILLAIPTVADGERLLCYPARTDGPATITSSQSISVHGAVNKQHDAIVDLEAEWSNIGNLKGPAAAMRSARLWQWSKEDQIPYTFPPIKSKPKKQS